MEQQGFIAVLDEVYRSGVAHAATSAPIQLATADELLVRQRCARLMYLMLSDAWRGVTPAVGNEGRDRSDLGIIQLPAKGRHAGARGLLRCGDALRAFQNDPDQRSRIPGRY